MKIVEISDQHVWRVARLPADTWAWINWKHAHGPHGSFTGRWDSPNPKLWRFRTIYAGKTLLACFIEVLAHFREDADLTKEIDEIYVEAEDAEAYPTVPAGQVPIDEWVSQRTAGSAQLHGKYCFVTHSDTINYLRPYFSPMAESVYNKDFDAATLKDERHRDLTQRVAVHLWRKSQNGEHPPFDGLEYLSRHGDDLKMWAAFEPKQKKSCPPPITNPQKIVLNQHLPELLDALDRLRLEPI